jgi:4-alpha-glucanotransferase
MKFPRASGILLHPTSLPGQFGIGDLGPSAFAFVDMLAEGAQTYWQILPLGPTGYGDSPYQCFSAFGGNTLMISPELLLKDGLLTQGVHRW